ncbi:hypothetical protein N656DRAFT_785136, partial [Canariomyces notabilis]
MFAKTGIAGHVVSISNLEFSAPQSCDVAIALASPGAKAHVSPTQNRGGALSLGYPCILGLLSSSPSSFHTSSTKSI